MASAAQPDRAVHEEDEDHVLDATDLVVEPDDSGPQPVIPPTPPPAKAESPPPAPDKRIARPVEADNAAIIAAAAAQEVSGTGAWFEQAFTEHYFALARPKQGEVAAGEVDFFLQVSGLERGASILDIGCGAGDHAFALAARGYAVTGLDASLAQLARACEVNEARGAGVRFVRGDMRDPPLDGSFAGILCVGTTLGYFDDEDNRRCVRKMRDLLVPGGRLLLQVFNRDSVIGRLPARSWWQGQGCLVLDETHMNYFTNRIHVHRTIVFEDRRQHEHNICVRAYTAHDLGRVCADVGLRVMQISEVATVLVVSMARLRPRSG